MIGLLIACLLLAASALDPADWKWLLWPSYIVSLVLHPGEEGCLPCDLAPIWLGAPVYILICYGGFRVLGKIRARNNTAL